MPQAAPSTKNLALIAFARRLADRLEYGIYPPTALQQIAQELQATGGAQEASIAAAANAIAESIKVGEYGWPEHTDTFGEQFVAAVIAGHQGGMLPTALKHIADTLEAEIRIGYTDAPLIRLINARIAFARRVADKVKLVPLPRALHLVAEEFKGTGTEEDSAMATAAENIADRINEGMGPEAWREYQGVLGEHLITQVSAGHRAHDLTQALRDAADTYESDLRALLITQAALNAEVLENA